MSKGRLVRDPEKKYLHQGVCPHCGGTGKAIVPHAKWRIQTHMQDGSEWCEYPDKKSVIKRMKELSGRIWDKETIYAPDGAVYFWEEE